MDHNVFDRLTRRLGEQLELPATRRGIAGLLGGVVGIAMLGGETSATKRAGSRSRSTPCDGSRFGAAARSDRAAAPSGMREGTAAVAERRMRT